GPRAQAYSDDSGVSRRRPARSSTRFGHHRLGAGRSTIVGLLALVVVFQPELRRALMQLDVTRRRPEDGRAPAISAVSEAAWSLARARCGAIFVVVRKDSLSELVTAGVQLDGLVTTEILETIFRKESPVHDGAAII